MEDLKLVSQWLTAKGYAVLKVDCSNGPIVWVRPKGPIEKNLVGCACRLETLILDQVGWQNAQDLNVRAEYSTLERTTTMSVAGKALLKLPFPVSG